MDNDIDPVGVEYCDPLFDRTLEELRAKGGYAFVAAAKANEFLAGLSRFPGISG